MRQPQTIQELLGRHMAAARMLAGISQHEMATQLQVRQPYVTQLEKGQWVNIDPVKLMAYVRIGLDVSRVFQEWLALEEESESEREPTAAG